MRIKPQDPDVAYADGYTMGFKHGKQKYERSVKDLESALEVIRDGPYRGDCGFCIARVEKAGQALKGE